MNNLTKSTTTHLGTRRALAVLGMSAIVILGAGCGDDDPESADPTSSETSESTASTTATSATASSTSTSTSTSDPASTSTETTMPGVPFEGFVSDGDVLSVVGVAHDDVLNIREAPGTDQSVVATAAPSADDVVATGEARELPQSIWYEVSASGETGWANIRFLAFAGGTDDATNEFLDGAALPITDTMVELGELVAAHFASEEPESLVVQSVAPTVGDLGEITYDVIGIGDDAVAGYRLHVFGTPSDSGDGFGLKSIERTTYCFRGLDGELCV